MGIDPNEKTPQSSSRSRPKNTRYSQTSFIDFTPNETQREAIKAVADDIETIMDGVALVLESGLTVKIKPLGKDQPLTASVFADNVNWQKRVTIQARHIDPLKLLAIIAYLMSSNQIEVGADGNVGLTDGVEFDW